MKRFIAATALVVLAVCCGVAFADGASFLPASAYLTKAQESSLNVDEKKALAERRVTNPGTIVIALNTTAMDSGLITITVPGGKEFQFVGAKAQAAEATKVHSVWRGSAQPKDVHEPVPTAVFATDGKGGFYGLVKTGTQTFELIGLSDRYQTISEVTRPAMTDDTPPKDREKAQPVPSNAKPSNMRPLAFGDPTIRILTVFSPAAASYYGAGSVGAVTATRMTDLNQSFVNSAVNLNVLSAGTMLSQSAQYDVAPGNSVVFASTDIPTLVARDNSDADLTMVVMKPPSFSGEGGEAFQVYATAQTAFGAVTTGAIPFRTYEHEFGHLLGARHQWTGGNPSSSDDASSYPAFYDHGFWIRSTVIGYGGVCYHTIMSYESLPNSIPCNTAPFDEDAPYWSNSSVSYRGFAAGNSSAMNAVLLNNLGPAVTGFHNTKLALPFIAGILASILFID